MPTVMYVPPDELSRRVCFCTRHKRYIAYAFSAASVFLPLSWLVWASLLLGAWTLLLGFQWQAFQVAVRRYRQRGTIFVVHTGEEAAVTRAQAFVQELEQAAARSSKKCQVILKSSQDFDPWLMLAGSHSLVFVTDDSAPPPSASAPDRFLLWLLNEKSTRLTLSALTGWNTNIVYTEEGRRRTAFQRLNYATLPCACNKQTPSGPCCVAPPPFRPLGTEPSPCGIARQVDGYLNAFAARRMCADAEVVLASATTSEFTPDWPGFDTFFDWALACPCCDQISIERVRQRPSTLRVAFWRQHLLLLTEPSMRGQLWRFYKQIADGLLTVVKSFEFTWVRARIDFMFHVPPPPPVPPIVAFQWDCAFGDPELVDESAVADLDLSGWTLNTNFVLSEGVGRESPLEVDYEFAASFPGPQLCVTHPCTGAVAVYQVINDVDLALLKNLDSSTDFKSLSVVHRAWLVQAELLVPPSLLSSWEAKQVSARNDLAEKGWTVFDSCALIPAPFLKALRRYYRKLDAYLFEAVPVGPRTQRAYNDEPVARQIQQSLTGWVHRLTGEPLAHSSLALSLFIRPGPGFIFHTDTSPPFDITLDVVVDHEGPSTRPLYFTRPDPKGGLIPLVEKLELRFGEAVLFRGSELTHWGGDMGAESHHRVVLGTWQFIKD